MTLSSRISLKIIHFFRKHGKKILIAIIIWLIIFILNQYLKNRPKETSLSNSYTPDIATITGDALSASKQKKVKAVIQIYFDACNSKDYETAYNTLTDDCKDYVYDNDIENFKKRIDEIYTKDMIYNLQNYSNYNGKYIYDMYILEDIGATGTTGGYDPYKDKVTVMKTDDGYKLADYSYIEKQGLDVTVENEYMKVHITRVDKSYSKVAYTMTITNRTDRYLLIADNTVQKEVVLDVDDEDRTATNLSGSVILVEPGEEITQGFVFYKYYDSGRSINTLKFNSCRLLDEYDDTSEDTTSDAYKVFSLNVENPEG